MPASLGLDAFIDEMIRRTALARFYPTDFIKMRVSHGTVQAISKLVVRGDVQSGFAKLKTLGLLDWSIEAAVTKFPKEFTERVIESASFRLLMASPEDRV